MNGVLRMPRMGETMEEGRLRTWLVEPGEPFKRGDPILEVETDKTIVEFPALGDGILIESLVELGDMIDVGAPIAKIDLGEGPDWTGAGENEEEPEPSVSEPLDKTKVDESNITKLQVDTPLLKSSSERVRATPLARRTAKRSNIDISQLTGTGRRGRVEYRDVVAVGQNSSSELQLEHGIAWLQKGNGSDNPVFLLHGFAADHSAWAGLQTRLARSGHSTYAIDLPGHGKSVAQAATIEELCQPLISMIEKTVGWVPIHIVAHSMGAIAAAAVAKALPTASITLIAPVGVGRTIDAHFLHELSSPHSSESVARTLDRLTKGPNGLSGSAHEAIFETLQQDRLTHLSRLLAGSSGQAIDIRRQLTELSGEIPVSMILGHRDQIISWSEALDISPLIAVHHFGDAGHMPHWEALEDVFTIIKRKLA